MTAFPKGKYFPFASLISKNPYCFWFHQLLASSYSKVLSLAIQEDKWKGLGQEWLLDSSRRWQNTSSVRKGEDTSGNLVSISAIPLSMANSENDHIDANSSCLIVFATKQVSDFPFPEETEGTSKLRARVGQGFSGDQAYLLLGEQTWTAHTSSHL